MWKWGAVRDVVWCIMWPIWCDFDTVLQSGLREVRVGYEMCEMVRNGATWNVVWFGIMPEMAFDVEWCIVKCGGNVTRCEMQWQRIPQFSNISHRTTFPAHHTTYLIPPDHTITVMAWCGQCGVEFRGATFNILQCQMWDVVPYSSWCGCDVE